MFRTRGSRCPSPCNTVRALSRTAARPPPAALSRLIRVAAACDKVTGIDSSRPALETADRNAELNHRDVEWIEANAFDLLRDYADGGRHYDTIVLDPPAFAKTKASLPTATLATSTTKPDLINLTVDRYGQVACVSLNRSDRANALDAELTDALLAAVLDLRDDADVHAMVLTGRGSAFSAGGDFDTIRAMRGDRRLRNTVSECPDSRPNCSIPSMVWPILPSAALKVASSTKSSVMSGSPSTAFRLVTTIVWWRWWMPSD